MKFFNSDKSGFLSFVAKRMKALFALFFIIAGVQTLSAALVKGSWDGWKDHDLIHVAGNEYYVDIEMTNTATDEFGIDFNGSFYSLSNYTITNWCSLQKFYTNNSNCKFTHNAGKYRFRVWDDGNYRTLTITGIIVTIDQPVQNADGSYTITGRFTNANPDQQIVNYRQIVFTEGVDHGVGANEIATTVGEDGSFSITKQLDEGQQYTCCARVIDGSIGNHDSKYITFTAQAATPEPEPTVTDLYIFGVDNNWSNPSDEWKCTSVSEDGNTYTWDWSSAPKTFNGSTYFKVGAKNAANTGIDDNNNYGPSGSDVTLDFNGVQSIVQTVVNSSASKAFTVSAATEISQIVFDKSDRTVTFYAPVETPTPVYAATITADASASQETAGQVVLTSSLTETSASTDLATATCVFQYKAADAAEGTEYSDLDASVAYSTEGATRIATLSQSMAAGDYVFRAVWTYNSAEVANAVTETVTIPSDTPTPTDIEFYVRGEKIGCTPSEGGNCWGVASGEFKATYKEGNVYVWDWTEPKLMVGPFKIADANFSDANNYGLDNKTTINLTDGKWTGTLQVNTASGDMIISEPGWNVSKITFDYDTKILEIFATPVFKDIWFRSDIVQPGGWNNDTTDPIDAGIDAKWQGHTSDGVVYTWDWSGADAVELSSDTEFKFGEYSGSNWAANGYAPDGVPQITLANMGTEIPVLNGEGNFSAGEDILVTRMTLDIENLTLVVKGEAFRPLANAQVVVERSEIGSYSADAELSSLRVGDKVTITASFNEGYETGYSVSFSAVNCDMEDVEGNANAKTFTITAENPVITLTFMSSCQKLKEGFPISGQFNLGKGLPWVGTPINSGEDDPADGCFAGGDDGDTNLFDARTFTLTSNSVPANYFEWECVGYKLDGTSMDIPEITWANQASQSATATVNLPGTYTFRLKAKCNESDEWINSADLTITAPVPQIGFDGEDGNIGDWQHAWAGQGGLMTRQSGTLTWKSNAFTLGNLASEFVIIQRYKLGCVGDLDGWDGYQDNGCDYHGNKINYADLELNGINGGTGGNFSASNTDAWVANETQLQLTVTMTGWDSYTVELAKKQEQIKANYSSNDVTMGTVTMKVGDTTIANGDDITAYIGQQVTLTATPAQGYKVASWEINGKVTESDRTTITPKLSGEGLNVVVTFKRDCYSGVVYDLNGGGIICADGGSTELSLNTLNNVTYQLYKGDAPYGEAVQGNGEAAKWTISEAGTYTAKAYDSRFDECEAQAIDMNGSADVTTVAAPEITVKPGKDVHLTVLQARSFTTEVPVNWSITDVTSDGDYCTGDGYMISSQTDTSLVAKFLCIGKAKITATMKAPNQNCKAEVTVHQNGAETEVCAPEPEDMQ